MNAFGQKISKDRKVHFGADTLHEPDFLSITSVGKSTRGQDSMNKPFDNDALRNPFKESVEESSLIVPPRLTYDMMQTLQKMSSKISIPRKGLLKETEEI